MCEGLLGLEIYIGRGFPEFRVPYVLSVKQLGVFGLLVGFLGLLE